MKKEIESKNSSGNVFADLAVSEPVSEKLKAELAVEIFRILDRKNLTQLEAAKVLGVSQPEISKLKHGEFSRFGVERLFDFLNKLGRSVEIRLAEETRPHQRVVI